MSKVMEWVVQGEVQGQERAGMPPLQTQTLKPAHVATPGHGTAQTHPRCVQYIQEGNTEEDIKINEPVNITGSL